MNQKTAQHYDLIIIGAGLVGTALAAALNQQNLRIAILETHLPSVLVDAKKDTRPITLAYGSKVILQTLNIWPDLAEQACPITEVHVSEQGRFGMTRFCAQEQKVDALGFVVPFTALRQSLYHAIGQQPNVTLIPINHLVSIEGTETISTVKYVDAQGEQTLTADLVVGADGTKSHSRHLQNIAVKETDHHEVAMTALLDLQTPHQHMAYERFTPEGVLALLPMFTDKQLRLVWTLPQKLANDIQSLSEDALLTKIKHHFGGRLHAISNLHNGASFPLKTVLAKRSIRPGFVLIGNAAHTIYPVAAQGFNLGLRDVAVLSEVLVEAKQAKQALGALSTLEHYDAWRKQDQTRTTGLTRGISGIFDLHIPMLGALRGLSLGALDLLPMVKKRFARRTMGMAGRLPKLARGLLLTEHNS